MIKNRLYFLTVFLVAVLVIIACAPAAMTEEPAVAQPATASAIDSAPVAEATVPNIEATQVLPVQAVATSRGSDLHATDPSTVSLSAGQLQLVEFFRFT